MYFMMDIMGFHDAFHVTTGGFIFDFDSSVHDDIMKNKVK